MGIGDHLLRDKVFTPLSPSTVIITEDSKLGWGSLTVHGYWSIGEEKLLINDLEL